MKEVIIDGITYVPKENPDELQDKDAVICWDDEDLCTRYYRFFNAKNNCSFTYEGKRGGTPFENYEKIPRDSEPEWMTKARTLLEE